MIQIACKYELCTHILSQYIQIFISNYNKNYEIIGINKIFSKKTLYTDFCFSGAYSNIDLNKKQIKYLKNMI